MVIRSLLYFFLAGKAGKNYTIKLYPVLPKECFKEHRFSPNVNNVRLSWFKGEEQSTEEHGKINLVHIISCVCFSVHVQRSWNHMSKLNRVKIRWVNSLICRQHLGFLCFATRIPRHLPEKIWVACVHVRSQWYSLYILYNNWLKLNSMLCN